MSFLPRFWILLSLVLTACVGVQERRSAILPGNSIQKARQLGLVDVRQEIPDIAVDLRYTTARNVTGHPIYPPNMPCLLRSSTAKKLKQVQATLRAQGYGLRIWDAWRPPEAHRALYGHGAETGMFVDPKTGWSRHCAGVSIDATLVDRAGNEQRMPTYFDEDMHKAASSLKQSDPVIQRNLEILHQAMNTAGLKPLDGEWWHFDDLDFLYRPIPVIWGREIGVSIVTP